MRDKGRIKNNDNKKAWLKIHVTVNVKITKILSIPVTDEHVHDSKALLELIENKVDNTIPIGKTVW
ncbi:MAG TPA: transposase [Candidatus Nitrosocosmicus sp.]